MRSAVRCSAVSAAALVAVASLPGVASASLAAQLQARTEVARRAAPELGVHVVDLDTDETVYAFHADVSRIVASNTKLVTTAAALDLLGPGYLFETRVLTSGPQVGGALEGDLAVLGAGDPSISGRFRGGDPLAIPRGWGRKLASLGVEVVTGDVLLYSGLFSDGRIHPDWPTDQLDRWYEAPVDALSFNDNCVLVRVRPGSGPGRSARVELVPDLGVLEVTGTVGTTGAARRQHIVVHRAPGSSTVEVRGQIYAGAEAFESWVTVEEPVSYFGAALREGLRQAGVEVAGRTRTVRSLPRGEWRVLARHRTDLLATLEVINKRSQNFYAESLLKVLGAEVCADGSWRGGRRVVQDFLRERLGWEEGSYRLADGSGMSRGNRFTPRQLTALLTHMFRHRWGTEFLRSLPFSGEGGLRWERRLADEPYRGNVFAKTGGLRGVSTISGYVKARSGKLYAFSILCNATRGNALRAQDGILEALVENG